MVGHPDVVELRGMREPAAYALDTNTMSCVSLVSISTGLLPLPLLLAFSMYLKFRT